jgi:hypothetical protein
MGKSKRESDGGEAERIGATPARAAWAPACVNRWPAGSLRRHGRHPAVLVKNSTFKSLM